MHAQSRHGIDKTAAIVALTTAAFLMASAVTLDAQDTERAVVIEAEAGKLASAYRAPPDLSHRRISTLTKSYVLAPFSFGVEAGYEGDIFRHGLPASLFRQEVEMGLPARFTIGVQNQIEHFAGDTFGHTFSLETRYALADWNKLPLNPAISAEYRFGFAHGTPDSGEVALLISRDFPHLIERAMNLFVDQEFGGRESTSGGFAQSIKLPVLLPEEKLEVGIEMQYRSGGETIGAERRRKRVCDRPDIGMASFRLFSAVATTLRHYRCSQCFLSRSAAPLESQKTPCQLVAAKYSTVRSS